MLKVASTENFDFFQEINKLFQNEKIKFFNIKKINDINQLNTCLLPVIKTKIQQKLENYHDLNALKISEYLEHDNESLKIKMIGKDNEFVLKLLLNNEFNDNDYAFCIKIMLTEFISKELVFYQWETLIDYRAKLNQLIQEFFAFNSKITINFSDLMITVDKFIFPIFNTLNFLKKKNVKIGFGYQDSDFHFVDIKLTDVITIEQLSQAFDDLLQNKIFDLPIDYNFKNFDHKIKNFEWIKNEKMFQHFTINNHVINIDWKNLHIKNNLTFNLTPWSRQINVDLNYVVNSFTIDLKFKLKFLVPIDYNEIFQAFLKQLSSFKINAENFQNYKNEDEINNEIQQQILNRVKFLEINNKIYPVNLSKTTIKNCQVRGQNNQTNITYDFFNDLIASNWINLLNQTINSQTWIFKRITTFLNRFNQNNHFDLQNFTTQNTWKQVLRKIQQSFNRDYDFEGIEWNIENPSEIIYQINQVINGKISWFLTIKTANNSWRNRIYFKNILKINHHKLLDAAHKLRGWNIKNPFDLKSFNSEDSWNKVLTSLIDFYKNDEDFRMIQWIKWNSNQIINYHNLINGKISQTFKIKINNHQEIVEIYFKNIIKTNNHKFLSAVDKLSKFDESNRFDLNQITSEDKWDKVLKRLKNHFQNDEDFEKITWSIKYLNNSIFSEETKLWLSSNYITIQLENKVKEFRIYFKNIIKSPLHKFFDAYSEVAKFNQDNPFDLKGASSDIKTNQVLEIIKEHFKNNPDFKDIQWGLNCNPCLIYFNYETPISMDLNMMIKNYEFRARYFTVYFKNITKIDRDILKDVIEKIRKLKWHYYLGGFNLNYLSWNNSWETALNKVKQYFKDDEDFKDVILKISNASRKISETINRDTSYVTQTIYILFKQEKREEIVRFNNIGGKGDETTFDDALLKLENFHEYHPFELKGLNLKLTWKDALTKVIESFGDDDNFKQVNVKIENPNEFVQKHKADYGNKSQNVTVSINKFSKKITLYFKLIEE